MSLKTLFRQTLIYGGSTILIRFANWGLTPYYSQLILNKSALGTYAILMADVALLNIVYMIGMETSYFRFAKDNNPDKVFQTTQTTVFLNSLFLSIILILLATPICSLLHIEGKEAYVYLIVGTLFLENICNIPFAKLRLNGRPIRFSMIKMFNIFLNIALNIIFISMYYKQGRPLFGLNSSDPVLLIFIANIIPWLLTAVYFSKDIAQGLSSIDMSLFTRIFKYSIPLIFVGLAGMINEVIDRTMLDELLNGTVSENRSQVAIYNVNFKLAIIMVLAIQAFRMGAEPYFFNQAKEKNSKLSYAVIMDFFIIACCMILVVTNLNRELVCLVNESSYKEGLVILPILLLAKLFLGVYYNASIWFKLTDNTSKGAIITILGAFITVGLNYVLIPKIGYLGSAYATLGCYSFMAFVGILWGQKHYPIPYHFAYNILWIVGSVVYSTAVFSIFQGSIFMLILMSILFLLIGAFFAWKRWSYAKIILAE